MHPMNYTFHTINQYELKGTVLAPLTWIPCLNCICEHSLLLCYHSHSLLQRLSNSSFTCSETFPHNTHYW